MERIWDILGIDATKDKREIKRAYARLSKEIHPEEKPEEFQRLYEAYQRALQYASYEEMKRDGAAEAEIMPESVQVEGNAQDVKNWDRYGRFGFAAEDAQKEQLRLEKIEFFLYHWDRKVLEGVKTGTFLTEDWKAYLESAEFQEIMWVPIILRTIAEGIEKYFPQKEEVLLFFWNLYGFEKLEEKPWRGEELLLYETLCRVYKDLKKRQKSRIKIVIISVCALVGVMPATFIFALLGMPMDIGGVLVVAADAYIMFRFITGCINGE